MTERQQSYEITQRRKICNRINELQSSCKNLTEMRNNLSGRLSDLNKIVDQLLAEKTLNKYDSNLKIDLTSCHIDSEVLRSHKSNCEHQQQQRQPTLKDLMKSHDFSSLRNSIAAQTPPSDAFKIKLSDCLQEIIPKAKEIVKVSEHLSS